LREVSSQALFRRNHCDVNLIVVGEGKNGSHQIFSPTEEGLIFWTDRRTDGQTDRRTGILWKFWVSSASLDWS
jgi:hypothetical protein